MAIYLAVVASMFLFFYFQDWGWKIRGKYVNHISGATWDDAFTRRTYPMIPIFGSLFMAFLWPLSITLWLSDWFNGLNQAIRM